jgi:tripartite-type tricarboxylate transporter receptor subunit TctC
MARDVRDNRREKTAKSRNREDDMTALTRRGLVFGAGAAMLAPAHAQGTWPNRPVRIVVPFAPAGASDVTARLVAHHLTPRLGQQVIVENRPGASTVIGANEVAQAPGDGYTVLLAPPPFVITQFAYPNLPYDPVRAFRPIGNIVRSPIVLVVPGESPARSLREFIERAKARPGTMSYGSPGDGSLPHVAFELLKLRAGIDLVHVPYRGGGPAVVDLLGGRLEAMLASPLEVTGHVQGGRLRLIAVASEAREPTLPELPTFAEGGIDFTVLGWFGLVAPSAVPDAIVTRLNTELRAVLEVDEVKRRIAELGATPDPGSAEAFGRFLDAERTKWAPAVAAANVRVQ